MGGAQRLGRRRHGTRWLVVAPALVLLSLAACSDDGSASGETSTPESAETPAEVDADSGDAILIRTLLKATEISGRGRVLPGSLIGDKKFCPGGRFSDQMGRPEVGMVKTIECGDGQLVLGFDPDPSSMVQNSKWRVLEGTGAYAGMRGQGWMVVQFEAGSGSKNHNGHETYTGVVAVE